MMTNSRILFCLCTLVMFVSFVMLGYRDDGERIAIADIDGTAVLDIEPNSNVSIFICNAESDEANPPETAEFTRGSEQISLELVGPRPLELPLAIAAKYSVSQRMKCSVSETLETNDVFGDTHEAVVKTTSKAFVIAAVSSQKNTAFPMILFLSFLVMIVTGFSLESLKPLRKRIEYKRYDGILGFFIALVLATVIAYSSTHFLPPEVTLFPSYAEMMVMVAANFVAFLTTYIGVTCFRQYRNRKAAIAQSSASQSESGDKTSESGDKTSESGDKTSESGVNLPKFKPWISICLGVGFAITAAISVTFAPLPGLSTLEMASQLTSTLYMSSFFAVLAGVAEECIFRGLIQTSFEARENSRHPNVENGFAIAVATTLFVAMHVPQSMEHLWALIPIGLVSLGSGLLKIRYKSLYPCILLHMSYNATLLLPSILI